MFEKFYISDLSQEQAGIYMKTLVTIAHSDNILHDTETEFLKILAKQLSLDLKDFINTPEKDLSFINTERLSKNFRVVLLRDCIVLSCIDGHYSSIEKQSVYKTAKALDLEKRDIDSIEKWRDQYLF